MVSDSSGFRFNGQLKSARGAVVKAGPVAVSETAYVVIKNVLSCTWSVVALFARRLHTVIGSNSTVICQINTVTNSLKKNFTFSRN
jgi:hypothetical protein